jgi:uncharacterized protein (TIGR03435 family)
MSNIRLYLICALSIPIAMPALAQAPAESRAFEVVSVKLSEPFTPALAQSPAFHVGMKVSGTRVDIGRMRLIDLIGQAYGVNQNRVVAPDWLKTTQEIFDVSAKIPDGATTEHVPAMVQAMLAERFGLIAHREAKDRAGYALVTARGGPKLAAAQPQPEVPPPATSTTARKTESLNGAGGRASPQPFTPSSDGETTRYVSRRATLEQLAAMLEPILGQPVVDLTGQRGYYTIALDISLVDIRKMLGVSPATAENGAGTTAADLASAPAGSSVLTSLHDMGLNLEKRQIPVELLVVDRVEPRPTAN